MIENRQSPNGSEEFYVGYQPVAPAGLGRAMRQTVIALLAIAVAIAVTLAVVQGPFANSRFEFLDFKVHEGTLHAWPYPVLLSGGVPYLLVAPGKHGADDIVKGLDGHNVRLRGELIERGENRMLEVEPASLHENPGAAQAVSEVSLGTMTLSGEIVDTKCHFGVMNPGEGKVHRDCAVRCISGGIPAALLVRDADGTSRVVLLAGGDGRALGRELLEYVAEPVRIHGELTRKGPVWVLKAELKDVQRD